MSVPTRLIAAAFALAVPLIVIGAPDAAAHRRHTRHAHVTASTDHAPQHRTRHSRAHSRRHVQQPPAAIVGS